MGFNRRSPRTTMEPATPATKARPSHFDIAGAARGEFEDVVRHPRCACSTKPIRFDCCGHETWWLSRRVARAEFATIGRSAI